MAVNFPSSPTNGDTVTVGGIAYVYDSTQGVWSDSPQGLAQSIDNLTDVDTSTTTPANRQVLQWNSTNEEWGPADSGVQVYATIDDLPLSGVTEGSMALVDSTDKLYIFSDAGWYSIAIVNQTPSISGVSATYTLASDGTATTVTVTATDPEGLPVTYSIVSDTSGDIATVAQGTGANTNQWTITPSTNTANAGNFTLVFRANDGVNVASASSTFTLEFAVSNSNYTTALITSVGSNNDVNNSFTDSSTNNLTITAVGNATGGGHSPYRDGGYSTYFDGSDSLLLPSTSTLSFGSGDFCIEFFVSPSSSAAQQGLISNAVSSSGGDTTFEIQINASGLPLFLGWNTVFLTSSTAISANSWNHVVVCRNGTTASMFLNGTRVATNTVSQNFSSTNAVYIGRQAASASATYLTGYMRDVRVVKGSNVYDPTQTTLTVPTQRLTAITNTSLLTCHLAYIADGSTNNHAITVNGNTRTKPFTPYDRSNYSSSVDGGSIFLDGSGDYLQTSASSDLTVGTGEFTLECWFKVTQDTQQTILALMASSTNVMNIFYYHTNDSIGINDGSWVTGNEGSGDNHDIITLNTWHHLAVVRDTTNLKLYVNGIERYSESNSSNYNNDRVWVGYNQYGNALRGNIADVRLVKGTAVYTSNFTPPTSPLSAITNTELLISGTDAGIIDKSQSSWGVTLFSGAKSSTTQSKYLSSSIAFNGTSDWLRVYSHESIDFSNGDFTIEGWMYCTDSSVTNYVLDARTSSTTGVSGIWLMSSRVIRIYNGGLYDSAAISASDLNNQWLHFAVVRNGSTLQWYINGTASGSAHSVNNNSFFGQQGDNFAIGRNNYSTSGYFNGYMSDLRFTKGLARYTSNFTPPTEALKG